jgi:hypothetical protein
LIFWKQKYLKLLKNYPKKDGKLIIAYIILSLFLPIVTLWIMLIKQYS